MKAEIATIEVHTGSVKDVARTSGITEVRSGLYGIENGHWNRGLRGNWVTPWLSMSKASTCLYHCNGIERGFEPNVD
jgi:hypothetical protein